MTTSCGEISCQFANKGVRYTLAEEIVAGTNIMRNREEMTVAPVNYLQKIGLLMLLLVTGAYTKSAFSQETPKQEALKASGSGSVTGEIQSERNLQEHHFWDRENGWLFAGVGAARTLDYFLTLNMRRRGRQEIFLTNDVVDNHPAFATIEAAVTGTSIGASYFFHHYG